MRTHSILDRRSLSSAHASIASRDKKIFRDITEKFFRILDDDLEDDKCSASTLQPQLRYAWGSKDK